MIFQSRGVLDVKDAETMSFCDRLYAGILLHPSPRDVAGVLIFPTVFDDFIGGIRTLPVTSITCGP